jgi:hypothetical protein
MGWRQIYCGCSRKEAWQFVLITAGKHQIKRALATQRKRNWLKERSLGAHGEEKEEYLHWDKYFTIELGVGFTGAAEITEFLASISKFVCSITLLHRGLAWQ